jgi:hypothetical protein
MQRSYMHYLFWLSRQNILVIFTHFRSVLCANRCRVYAYCINVFLLPFIALNHRVLHRAKTSAAACIGRPLKSYFLPGGAAASSRERRMPFGAGDGFLCAACWRRGDKESDWGGEAMRML